MQLSASETRKQPKPPAPDTAERDPVPPRFEVLGLERARRRPQADLLCPEDTYGSERT